MKFFRVVLQWLQVVSPSAAAWLAERLFFTPPRRLTFARSERVLREWRRRSLRVDGRRVVTWRLGADDLPAVYLVHGWGSRGARLAAFAAPLCELGYAVVTYDAPGHGASGRGMSSMPEFARTLSAVVAESGAGRGPHAVVAHSFGCSGTALALSWGLEVQRLVFLAPAADPVSWVSPFARSLALRADVLDLVRARSERRIRFRWQDLNVCEIVGRLSLLPPLLVVHDRDDEVVSWKDGAAIAAAWRGGARLLTTHGLAHRGVTSDAAVVRQVVEFVATLGAARAPTPPGRPRSTEARTAATRLTPEAR